MLDGGRDTVGVLRSGWSSLSQRWAMTRESWNDSVQRHFESEYWDELERSVPRYLDRRDALEQVIADALGETE
jgi:hypothetical protein